MPRATRLGGAPSVRPRTALAAATLIAAGWGLVVPAAGVAQAPGGGSMGPTTEIVLNGPTIKGFKLGGSTLKVGKFVFFGDVRLTRRTQGVTETHMRTLRNTDTGPDELPKLEMNSSLSKGTLKARLRGLDRLSLTFRATEKAKTVASPKGFGIGSSMEAVFTNCTGAGKSRKGVLEGKLTISAGAYFDTISLKKLKATVLDFPDRSCEPAFGPGRAQVPRFVASGDGGSYNVRRLGDGRASHVVSAKDGPMARFLVADGDADSFSYTPDAATATVKGVGPLLSGTLTHTAKHFSPDGSLGSPSGGIRGKFVTGNVRVPGTGRSAILTVPGFRPGPQGGP
jgi:hypothetical protein